ncbi:hypothetical protein [Streptomyces lavendofoliae]
MLCSWQSWHRRNATCLAVPARETEWDSATIRRFPLRLPVSW